MHPTTSDQIATFQAAELRRRSELRHAHAPVRRSTGRHTISRGMRASLRQAWALLPTFRAA